MDRQRLTQLRERLRVERDELAKGRGDDQRARAWLDIVLAKIDPLNVQGLTIA